MTDEQKQEERPRFVTGGNFTVYMIGNEGVLDLYVMGSGGEDLQRLIDRKGGLHIFTRYAKTADEEGENGELNP